MDARGQVYFDDADKVPERDVVRLEEARLAQERKDRELLKDLLFQARAEEARLSRG